MIKESVERFFTLVKEDQRLADQLRAVSDPDQFDRLASDLARERGFDFTPADVRAAINETMAREPSELSEEELKAVAGGACGSMLTAFGGGFASSGACTDSGLHRPSVLSARCYLN